MPNAHLKGCGSDIQRQIQLRLLAFQMLHYIFGPGTKRSIIPKDVGGRELSSEAGFEFFIRISQTNGANPTLCACDQKPAQAYRQGPSIE